MKFSPKEKMRSMIFSNYPFGQKLSKFVLNTHLMNLEAFTIEYSPKLQILFVKVEIWYDWLDILF